MIVEVGGVVSVDCGAQTSGRTSSVAGCAPHVSEQVDGRLLHGRAGARSLASPSWFESRPHAHWTVPGVEDERSAGGPVQGQAVESPCRAPMSSLESAGAAGRFSVVYDMSISPARPEPVVDVLVPLVAECLAGHRGGLARLQAGDARISPEPQLGVVRTAPEWHTSQQLTIHNWPVSAFSGCPPSAGGLNRGSRHAPVQVGGSAGSVWALSRLSL